MHRSKQVQKLLGCRLGVLVNKISKRVPMRGMMLLGVSFLALSGCNRLSLLPIIPKQTPQSWLNSQPFIGVKIGTTDFILVQPSSTVLVYLLGIITLGAGLYFLRIRGIHQSRQWWGIALLLWGAGALFAGTSYQAFSYEIKCAGQEFCSWTSWWEIAYLIFSVASVDAMMVAEAYSCCAGKWRRLLVSYAGVNIFLYVVAVFVGAFSLTRFLISFELLLIVAAPNVLIFFVLNGWRYFKFRARMDLALVITWIWLGITLGGYFLYLSLDITPELWERGVWFSENDVLHIGLIIWMVYIAVKVANRIEDSPPPVLPAPSSDGF